MKKTSFTDSHLIQLLGALCQEENMPYLDRWFPQQMKSLRIPQSQQSQLWDQLKLCVLTSEAYVRETSHEVLTTSGAIKWSVLANYLARNVNSWGGFSRNPPMDKVNEPVHWGIPGWLAKEYRRRKDTSQWTFEQEKAFLQSQRTYPGLHVRFFPGQKGEFAQVALEEQGWRFEKMPQNYWLAHGQKSLFETTFWKDGALEIQDGASQFCADKVNPKPGQLVWDVCAGRGGKTLALGQSLHGKGALWATDISEGKLKALKTRVKRSGLQNIRILPWAGEALPEFSVEVKKKGGFDSVVVDAPCSASGTWRRDPDARFRLNPAGLNQLEQTQDRLLELGWKSLKSGGTLTYITCSWLVRENEDRVKAFEASTGIENMFQLLVGTPYFDANTMFIAQWKKP